jgi:hypothetical protein
MVSACIAAALCCSVSAKGAVAAHRFDRPWTTEMDETEQRSGQTPASHATERPEPRGAGFRFRVFPTVRGGAPFRRGGRAMRVECDSLARVGSLAGRPSEVLLLGW